MTKYLFSFYNSDKDPKPILISFFFFRFCLHASFCAQCCKQKALPPLGLEVITAPPGPGLWPLDCHPGPGYPSTLCPCTELRTDQWSATDLCPWNSKFPSTFLFLSWKGIIRKANRRSGTNNVMDQGSYEPIITWNNNAPYK